VTSAISSVPPPISTLGEATWLGVNSFERRCVGSLEYLARSGVALRGVHLLEYPTRGFPEVIDRQLRRAHRDLVKASTHAANAQFETATVEAYASAQFEDYFSTLAETLGSTALIIDISCMTKIHVVALSTALATLEINATQTLLAYTSPRSYGNLNRSSSEIGWSDVLIAPIGTTARMRNESNSRGVIIAGHESERLWAALNEVEPASGLLALGSTPGRPDITRLSEKVNRRVISHMTLATEAPWSRRVVDIADVALMRQLVRTEIAEAAKHEAPLILYPFGPKTLIYAAGEALLRGYPNDSWFVYPVPAGYHVSYSEGIGQTYWFSTAPADMAREPSLLPTAT